jgi:hypothetical protein
VVRRAPGFRYPYDKNSSSSSLSSTDSERLTSDVAVAFYGRTLRPAEFVCPFSDPSRKNPCPINTGRKKKTQISNHLRNTLDKGGDDRDPLDNDLRQSRLVGTYYLIKRLLLTESQRKRTLQQSISRSYQKRKERQKTGDDDAQKTFLDSYKVFERQL